MARCPLQVVEEAIQDGTGGGHVAQELTPVLDGAVAGHDGGAVFVTAHNHFQEVFAGVFGQGLKAAVNNKGSNSTLAVGRNHIVPVSMELVAF